MNVNVLLLNQRIAEKKCKEDKEKKKKTTGRLVLHYNQYYPTPNVNKKEV